MFNIEQNNLRYLLWAKLPTNSLKDIIKVQNIIKDVNYLKCKILNQSLEILHFKSEINCLEFITSYFMHKSINVSKNSYIYF